MRHLLGRLYWVIFLSLALIANADDMSKPVKAFEIKTLLVRIPTNPKQSYGINWGGAFSFIATPGPPSETIRRRTIFPALLTQPQQANTLKMLKEDKAVKFLTASSVTVSQEQIAKINISGNQPSSDEKDENGVVTRKRDLLYLIPTLQPDGFVRILLLQSLSKNEFSENDDHLVFHYSLDHRMKIPEVEELEYTLKIGDCLVLPSALFGRDGDNDYNWLLFVTVSHQN